MKFHHELVIAVALGTLVLSGACASPPEVWCGQYYEDVYRHNRAALLPKANAGDAAVQMKLGKMSVETHPCYTGSNQNVLQNYKEGYFWFSLAAARATSPAEVYLKRDAGLARDAAAAHLSPEQKAAVDKRVLEWKPSGT